MQGMVNWLSLLEPADSGTDAQDGCHGQEEVFQSPSVISSQEAMMPTDFLADESVQAVPSQIAVVPDGLGDPSVTLATSTSTCTSTHTSGLPSQQQQQLVHTTHSKQELLEEADNIIQQERLSLEASEAVERGRKSQIKLENFHGSARTDPRSNSILSHRALKR